MCDVGYLGANFSLPRPLCSRVRPEERDRQTEVRQRDVRRAPSLKDHRQRIPRFVIRRYLDKSILKKLFCHLQSLQIKTIFQEKKTIISSISENLLSRFIYGRDVIGANW